MNASNDPWKESKRWEFRFEWPTGGDHWAALVKFIKGELARGRLQHIDGPCMVTATFTMRQVPGEKWHTAAPSLATLLDNLFGVFYEAALLDEFSIDQVNIGKVIPGRNAVNSVPGVRISIMVLS